MKADQAHSHNRRPALLRYTQTLLGMIDLRQELEELPGCCVNVTEAKTLHPLIRSEVLSQAVPL